MTQKGYEVLLNLINEEYITLISCVISSRDKGIEKDFYEEIKDLCSRNGIEFYDKSDNVNISSEYSIAISWRWLIEESENLIVLHDSILPKYRGFAPLVNSLKNGEKEIGVTALFANSEYDRGDIICSHKIGIDYPITIAQAIVLISDCYIKCINFIFTHIANGKILQTHKQDELLATYSLWLNDGDYRIDWSQDSHSVERFVNAVGWPYSGAFTNDGIEIIKILQVEVVNDVKIENRAPGKVVFINEGYPVVVCGEGLVRIKSMTTSNGKSLLPLKKFRTKFI
jgi:methionyl-tRNA formyltransferase